MSASRTTKVMALSFGKGLTSLMALVVAMVMARILSQSELATYRQTLLAYEVAIPLLSLGLASGIYYFLPTEKHRVGGVVMDALIVMLAMGSLYALFIALGGNHLLASRFSNPAIVSTLVYMVPLPMVMLPAGLMASVMVVQNQVQRLTLYNVLSNLAVAGGVIAACLAWNTPESMILAKVGIGVVTGLMGIYLMLKSLPQGDWRPRWRSMKTMVAYSIPLVLASTLGVISLQLDKLIVSSMCSPEQFAVYSNGAIEIPLIGILTGSIAAVIQADLRRMVAAGDSRAALDLFRKAAEKSGALLIPLMMFLLVHAEPFILTLFSSKYAGSVLPFRLYLLILPIRIVNFGVFMMALGLTRAIMIRSLIGLCANLILSIILVLQIGYLGAIISTIICLYSVNCVLNFAIISRTVGCRWWQLVPFASLCRVAVVSLPAVLFSMLLGLAPVHWPPAVLLIVNAVVFTGVLAMGAWVFRVVPLQEEARRIRDKVLTWIR